MSNYLLNGCVVTKLAGKLPIYWRETNNLRSCTVGNNKMEETSVQFYLREDKRELDCLLIIFGNEKREREIVEKINEEIKFDHSRAILFTRTVTIIYNKKICVFNVYNWTENPERMTIAQPKVCLLKSSWQNFKA